MLTKIFVSSFKGESKSKGGAGVRERETEREHSPPIIVARVEIQAWTPLSKREGDWRRNAPASVYGMVTRDAPASYWPFLIGP